MWLAGSLFLASLLDSRELDSILVQPSNTMFIYLTVFYAISILVMLFKQSTIRDIGTS